MWSLLSPKPIEGQGKPPNTKPPPVLPLPYPPRHLRRPSTTTTITAVTKERDQSNAAAPIEFRKRRHYRQIQAPTYHAGVVAPVGRQWITPRDIRLQGPTKRALRGLLSRAQEHQTLERRFLSSIRPSRAVSAERKREFRYIPVRYAGQRRRSQEPNI